MQGIEYSQVQGKCMYLLGYRSGPAQISVYPGIHRYIFKLFSGLDYYK